MNDVIDKKVNVLAGLLLQQHWCLAVAESCTGGWLAKACTDLAGSSEWFERAFITYSNRSKNEMLGVDRVLIEVHGAVSEESVGAMVDGVLEYSHANIAVAISGIAGPGGGSVDKPVGTVCFGWKLKGGSAVVKRVHFDGERDAVRAQAVVYALDGLIELLMQQL